MNLFDIEEEPMHFNKGARIFACIVIIFIIICGIFAYVGYKNNSTPAETTEVVETTTSTSDTTIPEDTTTPEETTPEETTEPEVDPDPPVVGTYLTLTESERLILATLIRLECGGSSYECQMAAASVVVNRMQLFGLTLRDVVFQQNVFSPARLINRETGYSYYNPPKTGAYAQCWQVVDDICKNGPSIPYYVIYFRSGYYHSWATPYAQIGSLYFSYAEKYK